MRLSLIIFGLCTLFVVSATATDDQNISFWDMIPVIAQGKSLVQLIFGDKEGAANTQEHFLNEGLGSSQLRSGYFLVTGEPKKALEIQKKFVSNLEGVLDGLPGVGHVKGGIHLLVGDHDHGWQAIKAATSTSGAMVGAVIGGPVGAIGGHLLTDALISGADIVLNGNQSQPHGLVNYVVNIDKLKPGEHFDVLAGLVLDAGMGKKGVTKRGWFNFDRIGHEESAESHELQPLLEEKETDDQRMYEMPKKISTVTEEEDTKPKKNEPGPSKNTQDSSASEKNYNNLNFERLFAFRNFVQQNPMYKNFNFYKLWSGEAKSDSIVKTNFDGLENFQDDHYLENLDIDLLKNKLDYMTDDEKSLINKNDFRTVNTEASSRNCISCTIAQILKLKLETVRKYIKENLGSRDQFNLRACLESLKKNKLIKYSKSPNLRSIKELDVYLKSNAEKLENKPLLLAKDLDYSYPGHVEVLKFKMVKDNPEPVKLLIDYQYPGFLQPDLPNPFRFKTYIDTRIYKNLSVYDIEPLEQ